MRCRWSTGPVALRSEREALLGSGIGAGVPETTGSPKPTARTSPDRDRHARDGEAERFCQRIGVRRGIALAFHPPPPRQLSTDIVRECCITVVPGQHVITGTGENLPRVALLVRVVLGRNFDAPVDLDARVCVILPILNGAENVRELVIFKNRCGVCREANQEQQTQGCCHPNFTWRMCNQPRRVKQGHYSLFCVTTDRTHTVKQSLF